MKAVPDLDPALKRGLFLDSFLLQACWSFERMQGLGLALAARRWAEGRALSPQARRELLLRHLGHFNTQAHMGGFAIGMVCRLEAEGRGADPKAVRLKDAVSRSLAAIGDALFWGTLRPAAAALGALAGLALEHAGLAPGPAWSAGAAAALAAFNGPPGARWAGLRIGYRGRKPGPGIGALPWQGLDRPGAPGRVCPGYGLRFDNAILSRRKSAPRGGFDRRGGRGVFCRESQRFSGLDALWSDGFGGHGGRPGWMDRVKETFLTIRLKLGLHARPAALFVQEASRFKSVIKVSKDGFEINGKSVMGLMMLEAANGVKLKVTAAGPDEAEAIAAMVNLFERGFGEEEDPPRAKR